MGKDHLDTFLPMVLEAIRITNSSVVSVTDLQVVIENQYGLNIPQNAIETILHKAKRSGYLTLANGVFQPVRSTFESFTFRKERTLALKAQEKLNRSFRDYCHREHSETLTIEDAESAIRSLFERDQLRVAKAISGNKILTFEEDPQPLLTPSESHTKGLEFLAASFVYNLQETQNSDLEFLKSVIKGYMFANALFLSDPTQYEKKFNGTSVYFDTSFLMQLLGFNGEATKAACLELTELLSQAGVELKCFTHTKYEIVNILESCSHRIRKNDMRNVYGQAYRQTLNYFIERNLNASDIDVFISQVDLKLKQQSVQVVANPDFNKDTTYQIDEEALEEKLSNEIFYKMGDAAKRDVDSVSAIMKLRRGHQPHLIEDCAAIFVTTNRQLVNTVDSFFKKEKMQGLFPCITDHSMTNILWLKQPTFAPNLPWKRVVADCYATLQPSDQLWSMYMQALERGVAQGELTKDEYLVARSYLVSKDALMDVTLGEEAIFARGSEQEILRRMEERLVAEKDEELREERRRVEHSEAIHEEQLREERSKTENALTELAEVTTASKAAEERRWRKLQDRATKYAGRWTNILRVASFVMFVVLILVTSLYEPAQNTPLFVKVAIYVFTGFLALLSAASFALPTLFDRTFGKIETRVRQRLEKRYRSYLSDEE